MMIHTSFAGEVDRGHGLVSLGGSIIDTPCSIDTLSRDQSINMGNTPLSVLARDGRGDTHPFDIILVNCSLSHFEEENPNWRYFSVSFDGAEDKGGFLLSGNAKGVSLVLTDEFGNVALPGIALQPGGLKQNEQRLTYKLKLVANGNELKSGEFRATLRFRMTYY